jgi:hypothetical protein
MQRIVNTSLQQAIHLPSELQNNYKKTCRDEAHSLYGRCADTATRHNGISVNSAGNQHHQWQKFSDYRFYFAVWVPCAADAAYRCYRVSDSTLRPLFKKTQCRRCRNGFCLIAFDN